MPRILDWQIWFSRFEETILLLEFARKSLGRIKSAAGMQQKYELFPRVPRGFWRRLEQRWGDPLQLLEEAISLSESFGESPAHPIFSNMDDAYWGALRGLHARTILHARATLVLLSHGLVAPAWAHWRTCHESATITKFISKYPQTAEWYLRYEIVNKYQLAKAYSDTNHREAPTNSELRTLKELADSLKRELEEAFGRKPNSRDYGWSGHNSFKEIELKAFEGEAWIPRGEYGLASERVHAAPNAFEVVDVGDGRYETPIGPTNIGLTGPADLTALSVLSGTEALIANGTFTSEIADRIIELRVKCQFVGVLCWMVDPYIICDECGGHFPDAVPPDEIPVELKPIPCRCESSIRVAPNG